ncbi:MAG: ABC transporter ATP-binding protein, partial [Enhydrobacter sp.]|nr:ABC transporter ATP-binding protein [Enhydrobacter sp.]
RRQMQEELKAIQRRVGTTFVHVTHDQEEAMAIADTLVVLNDGRIEDMGEPERIYLRPASCFTATFMGDNNLLEGRVADCAAGTLVIDTPCARLRLPGEAATGKAVTLSLRPEHLHTADSGGLLPLGEAVVEEVSFFGTHHACTVRTRAGQAMKVSVPQKVRPAAGERLSLWIDAADVVVLMR